MCKLSLEVCTVAAVCHNKKSGGRLNTVEMRKITALMPSSATESPCRSKAAATTAWPKPNIATLRREQHGHSAIPNFSAMSSRVSPSVISCDFHVGSHNKTSQGHVVIVCLIFNRVQAAGAVDLGALQSTHHGKPEIHSEIFCFAYLRMIQEYL